MPDIPEKREDCPVCGEEIEDVETFLGGETIITPCGCKTQSEQVSGWLENTEGEDGE